jgi:FeS assembly SUF system regulator
MIRLSRLADYGIVLATCCARDPSKETFTSRELALRTGLPLPTVGKILKALCRHGILASQRGPRGGYGLARTPENITIAQLIEALDGPIALTECNAATVGLCDMENTCPVRSNWQIINRTVASALGHLTLSQMTATLGHLPIKRTKNMRLPSGTKRRLPVMGEKQ